MGATRVSYNDSKLEPAPFLAYSRNTQTTADGEIIGGTFDITIRGTLVAFMGSPTESGTFHTGSQYYPDSPQPVVFNVDDEARLQSILKKQEALRELFSIEGGTMEWQSPNGSAPLKCHPRLSGPITFEEGPWYNTCEYSINLQSDELEILGQPVDNFSVTEYISTASETWAIEVNDQAEDIELLLPQTFRITHQISAQGKRHYTDTGLNREAWEEARAWVYPKLGFDGSKILNSSGLGLPSYYQALNHVRSENIGEKDGSYSVTETWILSSGNALEEFNVSLTKTLDSRDQVSIEGTITGLEERDSNLNLISTKYDNASGKFVVVENNLLNRAKAYSGKSHLNSEPLNKTVGRNITAGTITYNIQYDDRPGNCFEDTKSEVISITNNFDTDVIASVGVLGRTVGPVLQAIGTHEATTRSLSIELVFDSSYGGTGCDYIVLFGLNPRLNSSTSGTLNEIIDAADPIKSSALNNVGQPASVSYITNRTETWEPTSLRYSFNTEWTYE